MLSMGNVFSGTKEEEEQVDQPVDVKSKKRARVVTQDQAKKKRNKTTMKTPWRGIISDAYHITIILGKKGSGKTQLFLKLKMTQLPTVIRENADVYLSFSSQTFLGLQALWKEVAIVERKKFMEIFRHATVEQYAFFCASQRGGKISCFKNCEEPIGL